MMVFNLRQPEIKETTIEHNEGTKGITNINVRGLGIGMKVRRDFFVWNVDSSRVFIFIVILCCFSFIFFIISGIESTFGCWS